MSLPRDLSQEEFDMVLSGLRAHSQTQLAMAELSAESQIIGLLLSKTVRDLAKAQAAKAEALRERLQTLFHHDYDWLGDGTAKMCLLCMRRHEPHCPACAGCERDVGARPQ